MSKIYTLNFLINSFHSGAKASQVLQVVDEVVADDFSPNQQFEIEPSQSSIDAILNFAAQYEVVKSSSAGNIELNLN